eukprot:COSAG04_NODE_660_length_11451_cov_7.123238_9_plen_60_part_00
MEAPPPSRAAPLSLSLRCIGRRLYGNKGLSEADQQAVEAARKASWDPWAFAEAVPPTGP